MMTRTKQARDRRNAEIAATITSAPNLERAEGCLQLLDTNLLRAVVLGQVDLNQMARQVFGGRGFDLNGTWVGFEASARIANGGK